MKEIVRDNDRHLMPKQQALSFASYSITWGSKSNYYRFANVCSPFLVGVHISSRPSAYWDANQRVWAHPSVPPRRRPWPVMLTSVCIEQLYRTQPMYYASISQRPFLLLAFLFGIAFHLQIMLILSSNLSISSSLLKTCLFSWSHSN